MGLLLDSFDDLELDDQDDGLDPVNLEYDDFIFSLFSVSCLLFKTSYGLYA